MQHSIHILYFYNHDNITGLDEKIACVGVLGSESRRNSIVTLRWFPDGLYCQPTWTRMSFNLFGWASIRFCVLLLFHFSRRCSPISTHPLFYVQCATVSFFILVNLLCIAVYFPCSCERVAIVRISGGMDGWKPCLICLEHKAEDCSFS